jgi:hypothetical protein
MDVSFKRLQDPKHWMSVADRQWLTPGTSTPDDDDYELVDDWAVFSVVINRVQPT